MASGDTLFTLTPEGCSPPLADFATPDIVADASTPAMLIPVLDFDGGANEHMDWFRTIPSWYSEATGFDISAKYAMDDTDGAAIELEVRILHIDDQTVLSGDLGIDGQTPVAVTDDPDATKDDFNYTAAQSLAKANFGSAAPGDLICIRVTRDITVGPNADDLQLAEILVKET